MAKIIDGKKIKEKKLEEFAKIIKELPKKLKLVVIQVGNNPASNVYIKNKKNICEKVGIECKHLKYDTITEDELINKIKELNNAKDVTGILVQLPLPKNINEDTVINSIASEKDVDGLSKNNQEALYSNNDGLVPCTALGIIEILNYIKTPLEGSNVVVIGRSKLVGLPLIPLLLKENATVTVCHSKSKNIKDITKNADVVIVAIGKKEYIKEDYIKDDAIVIDVGINRYENKLYGDCDFNKIASKCKAITPVPGGVGPLTVTMLINNVIKAYNMQKK